MQEVFGLIIGFIGAGVALLAGYLQHMRDQRALVERERRERQVCGCREVRAAFQYAGASSTGSLS
jgi:hypothetical protein